MDRIWQWVWDRYGARYSWAIYAISFSAVVPVCLVLSFLIVAFERSDGYVEAAAVTVGTVLVMVYVNVLPGLGVNRVVERWAAGLEVDRVRALEATYAFTRTVRARGVPAGAFFSALQFFLVGA